jgi:hypothetical protein
MGARFCTKCGRARPGYIADATCSEGGYCDWSLLYQPLHRGPREPLSSRQVVPVYWEIRFPVTKANHEATYIAKGPTRFTRIVGNVLTDGVELTSLKVDCREQLACPPLDLCFLPADNTNMLNLQTATGTATLAVFVRRHVQAKVLLIGPTYDGEHRSYRLAEDRASDDYVIMVEGMITSRLS